MRNTKIVMLTAAMAAMALPSVAMSNSNVPAPAPRRNAFRRGRRHHYGFDLPHDLIHGHRPAGSKLAKQMAKGLLTISRIR